MADNVNITALVCIEDNPITIGAWSHLWDVVGREYITFFVRNDRYTHDCIMWKKPKHFTLSLMDVKGRGMLKLMGTVSGVDSKKYDLLPHEKIGNYIVPNNFQYVYCCIVKKISAVMGHLLVVGKIEKTLGNLNYITINTWPKENWEGVFL